MRFWFAPSTGTPHTPRFLLGRVPNPPGPPGSGPAGRQTHRKCRGGIGGGNPPTGGSRAQEPPVWRAAAPTRHPSPAPLKGSALSACSCELCKCTAGASQMKGAGFNAPHKRGRPELPLSRAPDRKRFVTISVHLCIAGGIETIACA